MAISMNNHVFKGHRTLLGNKYVTYGELEFPTRYDIYQKSKTGFDWGNNSHGANQLAFSMLFQLTNKELALKYVDKFTKDIVRTFNTRDWVISAFDVLAWVEKNCENYEKQEEKEEEKKIETLPSQAIKPKKQRLAKSNVVKDVCKELHITQKELAEILEVPEGTVSSWAVKNEIPRLGKKAVEFYIKNQKNQKIVDSYKSFIELLEIS
jgi:DNA-binding transcriptional regulator YiaG